MRDTNKKILLNALEQMLGRCDGASTEDGVGFNGTHAGFARSLFAQYQEKGEYTPNQWNALKSMLETYKNTQLQHIDFSEIPEFEEEKPETSRYTMEDLRNTEWNEGREVTTSDGVKLVQNAPLKKGFWDLWNAYKEEIRAMGISPSKYNGPWHLTRWTSIQVVANLAKAEPKKPKKLFSGKVELKYPEKLKDFQRDHVKALIRRVKTYDSALDRSGTGAGKCLGPDVEVLMFDGSFKKAKDVVFGDVLMGDDSKPRNVLSTCSGEDEMYEITPIKGEPWICNKPHILSLQCTASKEGSTTFIKNKKIDIPLNEYLKKSKTFKHHYKQYRTGVDFPEKPVPVDPYMYGLWLADGTRKLPNITKTRKDKEVVQYMKTWAKEKGYNLRCTPQPRDNSDLWQISTALGKENPFKQFVMSSSNGRQKFIREEYSVNSRNVRLEILAGLLDGDGDLSNSGYSITTKYKELRDGILFIARSLGFGAYSSECTKTYNSKTGYGFTGNYHRISISGHTDEIPCKLERKKAQSRRQIKSVLRTGFSVKPLGVGTYYGFTLDGNRRFLLSDFTVTHNTYCALAVALEMGLRPIVMAPKSVKHGFSSVMAEHYGLDGYVNNYEQFKMGKTEYLSTSKNEKGEKEFNWHLGEKDILIFDEGHRCKKHDTQNAQMLVAAKKQGIKILVLTATIADNPTNMWATGLALELFSDKSGFFRWAKNYGCEMSPWGGFVFEGDRSDLEELHKELGTRSSRISDELLKEFLPENQIITDYIEQDAKMRKAFSNFDKELKELKKDGFKETPLTVLQKNRQKVEGMKLDHIVDQAQDLINEGNSVAIFLNFDSSIDYVAKKLKTDCVVRGSNKEGERENFMAAFQADQERIIILNAKAGGEGISLHDLNGDYPRVSLISPDWSAQTLKQVFGRIHRVDGKTRCIQKIATVSNSIEVEVLERVLEKVERIDTINEG